MVHLRSENPGQGYGNKQPPGQLSLAILWRLREMSTGDGRNHCWGRNGEFRVTVGSGPGLPSAGTLT